jgi:hypothetical protein
MSNQFTQGPIVQGTTLGLVQANQLVTGGSYQESSQACIVDLVPPVFSGISSLSRGALGQLQALWSAATDTSNPIRYEVYVKAATATNLFNTVNIALVTTQLNADIFALGDGSLLQTGVEYYVGVRAVDAVGNRDTNLVSLNRTTSGITGATNVQILGVFAIDTTNNLVATFWVTDNDGVITNPVRLGTASYVIYDNNGNLVPGMAEAGITFDSEGFFEITPVPSVLDLYNTFYTVKTSILVDGVPVIYNLPITYPEAGPVYEPRAVFSINASNQLQGSIWCVKNGELLNSALGAASFTIYDSQGNTIGISQSSIAADANGFFEITPVNAAPIQDLTHYVVKITILADGASRVGSVAITLAE